MNSLGENGKRPLFFGLALLFIGAVSCGSDSKDPLPPEGPARCTTSDSSACAPDEFCEFEEGTCGENDLEGICRTRPEACILIFAPVCGCDGITHGNDCAAAAAGTSIKFQGECPSE